MTTETTIITGTDVPTHDTTDQIADLRAILLALRAGDGCPIERRDAHPAVRDLVVDVEDADLDDPAVVDALIEDTEARLAALGAS